MSEHPKDDKEDFERHPDVRDLAGPDTEHLDEEAAARVELLTGSAELVKLDDVPVGGMLHIQALDAEGNPEETVFVRTGTDPYRQPWAVRQTLPDGNVLDEAAVIDGACLGTTGVLIMGRVQRGANLAYTVFHRATGKSGADFPADRMNEGIMDWSELPHVDDVDPSRIVTNIQTGFMNRLPDGSVEWDVPLSRVEKMTGLVQEAPVTLPEGQPPIEGGLA